MTTYSQTDLATRILGDLGIVGEDETPSAAALAWAIETASSEIAMMASIGLPIWNGSVMAVPLEYLTTLSRRCGLAVAPRYGLVTIAQAQMAMREAETSLTLLANPRASSPLLLTPDAGSHRRSFNFSTGR